MQIVQMERPARSNYYSNSYSKGDIKFRQRALVLRFMEKHMGDAFKPKFLTLPGEHWLFELMVLQRWPYACFVGAEKSTVSYNRSRLNIPRNALATYLNRDEVQDRTLPYGRSSIHYSRISNGISLDGTSVRQSRDRANRLILMDVNNLLQLIAEDHNATYAQKKWWVYKMLRYNAVWLDYTGTLSPAVLKGLAHLPMCLSRTEYVKPIVITVRNGRDQFKSKQERVAAIRAALPGLDIRRVWTYTGAGGSSMLTVCGTHL